MYVKSKNPQQTRTYMQMGHFMMSVDYTYLTYITCVCKSKLIFMYIVCVHSTHTFSG